MATTDIAPNTQVRQQVQVTLTLDVAVPAGGLRRELTPGSIGREPDGTVDVVPPYTELDHIVDTVVAAVNAQLAEDTRDGSVIASSGRPADAPYWGHLDDTW